MDYALILVREVAVMFLFIAAGIVCVKTKILDDHSSRALCNLCLMLFTPCMLVSSLQQPMDAERVPGMAAAFVLSTVLQVSSIFLAKLLVRDPGDESVDWKISRFSIVLTNLGFMGYPLLRVTVGEKGLLYGSMVIGVFNVLTWIWCPKLLTGESNASLRRLIRIPTVCAFFLGLILFAVQIPLPDFFNRCLAQLGDLNAPVSMLVIGTYLVKVDIRAALRDLRLYRTVAMRNALFPLLFLGVIWLCRLPAWLPGGRDTALTLIILLSCPSAISSVLMPSRYGLDASYGAKLISGSTLASIATLPLIVMLADLIL